MARKKKEKTTIKRQQRINPNSFKKINDDIDKLKKIEDLEENEEAHIIEGEEQEDDGNLDKETEKEKSKADDNKTDDEDEDDDGGEGDEESKSDLDENVDEENTNKEVDNRKNLGERDSSKDIDDNKSEDNNSEIKQSEELEVENDESSLIQNKTLNSANRVTESISKTAAKVKNSVLIFVKVITNPIFWITMLLLLVMAYITSVMVIVGQNDYNILCDDMGVGSLMLDPDADAFTRQSAIVSWMTSTPFEINGGQPLTKEQAIGIMGNMIIESYGANPRAIQNDHSITKWQTCDNNCVLSWGDVGGKAIGIIQWDTGRRIEMVKFAISEGTEWHDLNTQLKFLKKEMDSGYERGQLESGGFHELTHSIEDYVRIFNQKFERSKEAYNDGNNPRQVAANSFAATYAGSGTNVAGGLANYCIGGMGGVDTTNLIQLAIASAWPDKDDSRGVCNNPGYVQCGQTYAMAAYKEIKILAENNSTKDPIPGLLASCDRYVATMYRASGKDINMPWGSSGTQAAYMKSSPKWAQISCQDRQPGDVLWREGHVMLYIGVVNGKDSIGSASLSNRTGAISGVSCSGNSFIADGDAAIGFRMVTE